MIGTFIAMMSAALIGMFMGTYTGSPWGTIRGKVDDAVGGVWKGIKWLRVLIFPTQRGTITKYRLWKINPSTPFSFPQFNIRRIVLSVLGYIARSDSNIVVWIRPVWDALVAKRGYTMTGVNAFIKRNAAVLFASMTNIDAEYDPATNTIDLSLMLVSDGDLEPVAAITNASYISGTGMLSLAWTASTFTNGASTDLLQLIVAKKPLLDMEDQPDMSLWNWRPKLFIYPFLPALPWATRGDGVLLNVQLPADLDYSNLTAYLFFKDEATGIGYSPSKALQVTEGI